uniref:Brix domain-containing protein n=1 Tax=Strongyloides papillosus TaxID=174720 RepID=A0A0N5B2B2_STREA
MLENNLIFIASLMPDTVERLKISRNFNLSSRITDKLNECMPNIKLLTFYNGEIKNSVCLSAFRNLELFITGGRRRNIFEIPKTIKCIVLDHRFFYTDNRNMNFKKELVRRCCESFLKYSRTNEGTYIFFNDVTQWGKYKRLVQECLY